MNFSDRLANIGPVQPPNFSGGTGDITSVLGQILPYINQMKDDDLRRQKDLLTFRSSPLANLPPRWILDAQDQQVQQQQHPQNVVFHNPQMTPYEAAEIGIKKQALGQEASMGGAKLAETQKEYQGKLAQNEEKVQSTIKKEQDIHDQKQKELQTKVDKANKDLEEKQKEFAGKQQTAQSQLELHKQQLEVVKAQHELDNARRDSALAEVTRQHNIQKEEADKRIKVLEDAAKAKAAPTETTKETVTGAKPASTLFGIPIPFTGSEGKKTESTTTTTKGNGTYEPMPNQQQSVSSGKKTRDMAIAELNKHGKTVNENTIKMLLDNPTAW